MKLFLSGECGSAEREAAVAGKIRNRLLSYYYHGRTTGEPDELIKMCVAAKQTIFLDSGAFSAFNTGVKVPIDQFGKFCAKYEKWFDIIASLDVIGDAHASDKNFHLLRDMGATKVFPTFHYGEPFEFLDKMMKESKVIGLGGVAQLGSGKPLFDFLDACWARLTDSKGKATHKVHGFAVTSAYLIARYPWYSVDSASWLYAASYGAVAVFDNGKMNNVTVSGKSSQAKELGGRAYGVLSPSEQKWFRDYIAQCGVTIEQVSEDYIPRQIVNVYSYQLLEKIGGTRFKAYQMTLGE